MRRLAVGRRTRNGTLPVPLSVYLPVPASPDRSQHLATERLPKRRTHTLPTWGWCALCTQAHKEGEQAERTVGWLTHAHSEERALKQALKVRLEEAGAALARERCAHQAACTHYVEEVKQR